MCVITRYIQINFRLYRLRYDMMDCTTYKINSEKDIIDSHEAFITYQVDENGNIKLKKSGIIVKVSE